MARQLALPMLQSRQAKEIWNEGLHGVRNASNGYCYKFSLYTGKTYNKDPSECGKIYDLVTDLMKDYNGKGHH